MVQFFRILRLLYWIFFSKNIPIKRIQKQGLLSVKIAQMFAMRIDILPEEKCAKLSTLLSADAHTGDAEDLETLLAQYATSEWRKHFTHINPIPFAQASVGQVHEATLLDGTAVAIKLLKRDYTQAFTQEITAALRILKVFTLVYPKLRHVADPEGILQDLRHTTLDELDLRNEIKHQLELEKIFLQNKDTNDLEPLRFAKIYPELSSSTILVRELIDGKTVQKLNELGQLPYEMMISIFRIHGFYIFTQGTFHGDIHAGNIMVDTHNSIVFIDTGALARVSDQLRIGLFRFMRHLSQYNYQECIEALEYMAYKKLTDAQRKKYTTFFLDLYKDFAQKTVGEVSLTLQMMYTIKGAIEHGMRFERGMFPIIKSMMYLDAMVLRNNPNAKILEDMRPLTEMLCTQAPELND
jgi:ubiquinone biosynthesis protein